MLNDADLRWPTRDDYKLAIEDYHKNILDANLLRQGELKSINTHILNFGHPDSRACIYRIGNTMIRCFCQADDHTYPPDNIFRRYKSLERFIQHNQSKLSAFVPVAYIPRGIRVHFFDKLTDAHLKTADMPIVTMEYVSGYRLDTYVAENHQPNTQKMLFLCDAWMRMIREMEEARIAHGDLDPSNVFVQEDFSQRGLQLKLIDYDNTWIPEFETDYPLPEYGHRPFQHPAFYDTPQATFNREIDRFAALVIYISLKALAIRPGLYEDFGADDHRLLFKPEDYEDEQKTIPSRIRELKALRLDGLDDYIDELLNSLLENRMPASLDTIAAGRTSSPPVVIRPPEPAPARPPQPALQQDLRNAVVLPEGYREVISIDWNDLSPRTESQPQQPARRVPAPANAQPQPQPPRLEPVSAPNNAQQYPQQQDVAQQPEPVPEMYQEQMPYQGHIPLADQVRRNRISPPVDPAWKPSTPIADRVKEERARSARQQQASQGADAASPPPASESLASYRQQLDSAPPSYHHELGNFTGHDEYTEEDFSHNRPYTPTTKTPSRQLSSPNYMVIGWRVILALVIIMIALVIFFLVLSHLGGSHTQTPHQILSMVVYSRLHLSTHSFTSIFYLHKGIVL
jgi:serine/threonine protein kinase